MDDLVQRPASGADLPKILSLVATSLGESRIPRTEAFWTWKHLRNPFGRSPAIVAEVGGTIVALRVFLRWEWLAARKRVRAVRAVDTVTDPNWRGRGLFSKLTLSLAHAMETERVEFVFNTPNRFSRAGYLKMGWHRVGRPALWIRPRPFKIFSALSSIGRDASTGLRVLEAAERPLDGLLADSDVEGLLLASGQEDDRLTTARSLEYLAWRYADIPGFRYHARWMSGAAGRAAVIFRRVPRGRLSELRISEAFVEPNNKSIRAAAGLLRHIANEFDATFLSAIAPSGSPERVALFRAGLVPAPGFGPTLMVRPLAVTSAPDPRLSSNWRLSIGDLELM